MISIPLPPDDAETIFRSAASRTRDTDLRRNLLAVSTRVGERAAEYLQLAQREELFRLDAEDPVGVTNDDLSGVYNRALVKGKERPLYNRIKGAAKFGRCPLCGHRDVKTLDHYLSQSEYPELAVFPANLVPSCSDCNKSKLAHTPSVHSEQTFHPYFDDWGSHRILRTTIEVNNGVSVTFSVAAVAGFPARSLDRAMHHFELLGLGPLYSANAAVELVESKDMFRRTFAAGATVLRTELLLIARSRQRGNLNAWRAALYRGLAASNDFCAGGFEEIEE